MNDCYIVLGTYRSGTSVISKIISSLGISMSEKSPQSDNALWYPTGSFNDKFSNYMSLNTSTYWKLKKESCVFNKMGIRSFDLLRKGIFAKLINDCDLNIGLIWSMRNIEKSYQEYVSLLGRQANPDTIEKQHEICQNIFNSFNGKKITINYSDLMQNTNQIANQLADFCGVSYIDGCTTGITPKYLE